MNTTRQKADFKNILFRGAPFEVGEAPTGFHSLSTHKSGVILPRVEDVRLTAVDIPITDTGGASGGYAAIELLTLPETRIILLGAFVDFTVNSVAEEIDAAATVSFGVGTAATANSTIDSTEINFLSAAGSILLSSGAGTAEAVSTLILSIFDAVSATKVYLNIGVPDAGISASSSMNITAAVRFIYLDSSLGM